MTYREIFMSLWLLGYIIFRCVISAKELEQGRPMNPFELSILSIGLGFVISMISRL